MLSIHEHPSVEEASRHLLRFVLDPTNWLAPGGEVTSQSHDLRERSPYQRKVGPLRICASVDVSPTLEATLKISFRAPGLTPMEATDHLERFLRTKFVMIPNSEWLVEVDDRRWIHFIRRYSGRALRA
jgi:hypothetical protein